MSTSSTYLARGRASTTSGDRRGVDDDEVGELLGVLDQPLREVEGEALGDVVARALDRHHLELGAVEDDRRERLLELHGALSKVLGAVLGVELEGAPDGGPAQVGLDEDDAGAALGQRGGQADGGRGLALTGRRAGEQDGLRLVAGARRHERAQRPVALVAGEREIGGQQRAR